MPWKECRKMDEKLKFVSRFLDGEKIAALCREFEISRVTGRKFIDPYRESGLEAFTDCSRRPYTARSIRSKRSFAVRRAAACCSASMDSTFTPSRPSTYAAPPTSSS